MTLSAVCGLRIDLARALEMDEAGELVAEVDKVAMVRASSCSSSSIASMRPSFPFQVLKRELRTELREDEVAEGERWMLAVRSWCPSSEMGTSSERPMYWISSDTILERWGLLSLGASATTGKAMEARVGVLVTS